MNNDTASIFNGAIAASAITAAFEIGLLDELRQRSPVGIDQFCVTRNLHASSVRAVLGALQGFGIVRLDSEKSEAQPGDLFEQTFADKGYFAWLTGGYGQMMQNLGAVVRNEHREGDFAGRNGKRIAWAGRDYGAQFVERHFEEKLAEMPFRAGADIGCGSADRLIRLAQARPGFRGVGIEVNRGAVELAEEAIRAAGVQERVRVLQSDIQTLQATPECAEVEVMFSFFMGHDLWPREACLLSLNRLRTLFPNARRFLLCDTYRSGVIGNGDVPIFTLGFELTHAVMDHYVPSKQEWLDLFAESDWTCVDERAIDIPYSSIFDLR
jgi:hypothetical protein